MRLIDADKLDSYIKSKLSNMAEYELFATMIDNQPTAFDVGKVVEQLEKEFKKYYGYNWDKAPYLVKAIEIVKGGGQECQKETITTRLLQAFPRSIINRYGEFIAYRGVPESFQLDTCENEEEVKCKVLEWLSRAAFKTKPFASKKINDMFHCYMIQGINTFLGTSFSQSDMEIIYTYLGNNINREKCLKFIRSGYDMGVLKKEAVKGE